MANPFVKAWKYFLAAFSSKIDEHADPKVQIQQAIEDAQRQHQALSQQAAAVIGNQRQLEMKLNRQLGEIEKTQASARQALILARSRGVACGLLALDFMYYLPLGTTTCRVTALVVAEDAQGQGVDRLLLRDAERRARLGGAARLEVTSAGHRTDAHAFYRACGFTEGAVRFVKLLGD